MDFDTAVELAFLVIIFIWREIVVTPQSNPTGINLIRKGFQQFLLYPFGTSLGESSLRAIESHPFRP